MALLLLHAVWPAANFSTDAKTVANLGLSVGDFKELQIGFNGAPGGSAEVEVVQDAVLHTQHLHIGAQGHLAQAVAVEVKLILTEVVKVLEDIVEHLEGLHWHGR